MDVRSLERIKSKVVVPRALFFVMLERQGFKSYMEVSPILAIKRAKIFLNPIAYFIISFS